MKAMLLTVVAALTLPESSASAHTCYPRIIYDQKTNFGSGVNSQTYESANQDSDDAAADDFVVPAGYSWTLCEIDVAGSFTNGSGPPSSVTITVYDNKHGKPGDIVINGLGVTFQWTVACDYNTGSFYCPLPSRTSARLRQGTYWLSVVANCDLSTCGTWSWTENTVVAGKQAVWQNPNGGWNMGCSSWESLSKCGFGAPADLAFLIWGTVP